MCNINKIYIKSDTAIHGSCFLCLKSILGLSVGIPIFATKKKYYALYSYLFLMRIVTIRDRYINHSYQLEVRVFAEYI